MVAQAHHPNTPEEHLIYKAITWTWGLYLIGGLYVAAPVIGWLLIGLIALRAYVVFPDTPPDRLVRIPFGVWPWVIGMLVMELALIIGHLQFGLGVGAVIKSSVGWAKGWALLAVYIMVGACLRIRPEVLYRAAAVLGVQTVLITPILVAAMVVGLPQQLYVSPLRMIGGPGDEFFSVILYSIDGSTGAPRWRFWTPWGPAAGFVANILFILIMNDSSRRWRIGGYLGCILMILLSQSRLAFVCLFVVVAVIPVVLAFVRPWVVFIGAAGTAFLGMIASTMLSLYAELMDAFTGARAGSSRVRAALGRLAVDRWQAEAYWWGHGVVETGPKFVEHMPIGSHHSWYGLLFVKGVVGFAALAAPLAWSILELLLKAPGSRTARAALQVAVTIFLYTFGENLEILSYLFWPGLVLMGIAIRQPFVRPPQWDAPSPLKPESDEGIETDGEDDEDEDEDDEDEDDEDEDDDPVFPVGDRVQGGQARTKGETGGANL